MNTIPLIRAVLLTFSLLLAASGACASVRVIDGDTLVVDGETVRILNIDTAEIREPRCAAERAVGLKAKHRLEALVGGRTPDLRRGDGSRLTDRYGRTLALVFVDGHDLGEQLILEGLARRWNGKRRPWCP